MSGDEREPMEVRPGAVLVWIVITTAGLCAPAVVAMVWRLAW